VDGDVLRELEMQMGVGVRADGCLVHARFEVMCCCMHGLLAASVQACICGCRRCRRCRWSELGGQGL